MIKTQELIKVFRTEEVETTALNKVNLEIKQGEFVAIMGPSGCGKSTLLNIIGLLDNPSGGDFYFNGIEVSKFKEKQRTNLRKSNIGFVFQSFNLIDELTVFENVELPLLYMNVPSSERRKKVEVVLEFRIVNSIFHNSFRVVSNKGLLLHVQLLLIQSLSLPMSQLVTSIQLMVKR